MIEKISITSERANSVVDLTQEIRNIVKESNVKEGMCYVYCPHTTAALTVTSFWDERGFEDIQDEIGRLIPTRIDFKHQHDTPQDAAGHVKSSLIGITLSFFIEKGDLFLGSSQGIYFLEFDGPRKRKCYVKIVED